ncbi:hypothetical protein L195_g042671, partial [Trifolium pratense]
MTEKLSTMVFTLWFLGKGGPSSLEFG